MSEVDIESLTLEEAINEIASIDSDVLNANRRRGLLVDGVVKGLQEKGVSFGYGTSVRIGNLIVTRDCLRDIKVDLVTPAPELVEVLVPVA